jgi:hypothetical protein
LSLFEPLSINQRNLLKFTISPVPTSNILNIQSDIKISRIEIYDNLGNLVLIKSNGSVIDISSLPSGLYFCKIMDGNNNIGIEKFIRI